MARIIDLKDKSSLSEAARVLKEGKILVFPSDTVYGIGCVLEKPAIRKLYKIKNCPLRQPTGILLTKRIYDSIRSSAQSSINIINLSEDVKKGFLAGKITLILPKEIFKLDLPSLILKNGRVGVRLPNHRWLIKLIENSGPIVASSANQRGRPAPADFRQIENLILKRVDLVIRSKDKSFGHSSAVYDLGQQKYLRK